VGSTYDSGDPPDSSRSQSSIRIGRIRERREGFTEKGLLRGIGCAMFIEPSGGGAAPQEQAAIKFGESGNATLYVLSGPSGQAHETVFPLIVSQVLGLPLKTSNCARATLSARR
jgi:carbon-monoxide dehydrogenase large subunit